MSGLSRHADQPGLALCRDTIAMGSGAGEAFAAGVASVGGAAPGGETEHEAGEGRVNKQLQDHQACKCQICALDRLISAVYFVAACLNEDQALQE